jgi:hypothetical protein
VFACPTNHYDVTVARTSSLFSEKERLFHRQILRHLKDYRNGGLHSHSYVDYVKDLLYQLKRYVEEWFIYHLNEGRQFSSLEDAVKVLE